MPTAFDDLMRKPPNNLGTTLEEKIRHALSDVPKEKDLKDRHPSLSNRRKVRRRMLLQAVHDVVFHDVISGDGVIEHMPDGGVIIALDDDEWTEASSEYSAARRDFIHDAERLDNGHKAELILAPVDEEAPEQRNLVSANRKIVLLVLLFINTSDRTLPEAERIAEAVKLSGLDGGTLRTYIRELNLALKSHRHQKTTKNPKFSEAECAFYTQMYKKTKDIARREGNGAIAKLLAPAISVLAADNLMPASRPRKVTRTRS